MRTSPWSSALFSSSLNASVIAQSVMNCSAYKSQAFAEADSARALGILPQPLLVHFLFRMIPIFSFIPLCPAPLFQVLLKTAKNGPVKSRTAKEAFGIYECRGVVLWTMSSLFQLPVSVVKVKQIILRQVSSLAEWGWSHVFASGADISLN